EDFFNYNFLSNALNNFLVKKKVAKVIYRAETSSASMGVSSIELIKKFAVELEKDKRVAQKLHKIRRELDKGRNKEKVYAEVLDKDILVLLEESRVRQIPSDAIFQDYVPLKEISERTESSIRRRLYFPIIIFTVLVLLMNTTMKQFYEIQDGGMIEFSAITTFMMKYYLEINFIYGLMVSVPLIFFPDRMPGIQGIFLKIRGMLALSTAKTMVGMAFPMDEILKTLKKQFQRRKQEKKKVFFKDRTAALLDFLQHEGMISLMQSAELKIGSERNEFDLVATHILKEKQEEVADLGELINAKLGLVSLIIMTPPIIMLVLTLVNLMSSAAGASSPTNS
ncbi:MAG: hypothetical protein JW771_08310, partial [Candidatus Thermoplasmatota archaeon]|nr:hypothetical protein [Candidatus Thermoplasmatota archaeon]